MANQGAKKRKEENRQHMANLQRLIIACNVLYILLRLIIFHSSFSWKHWVGLIVTSLAYWISYQQLAKMAKPTYSDDRELLDGGFDMSTGGICRKIFIGCHKTMKKSERILRSVGRLACKTYLQTLESQASDHSGLVRVYGLSCAVLGLAQSIAGGGTKIDRTKLMMLGALVVPFILGVLFHILNTDDILKRCWVENRPMLNCIVIPTSGRTSNRLMSD